MLPRAFSEVFFVLVRLLKLVADGAERTRMPASNLGVVFAPCLLHHPDPATAMANNKAESEFVRRAVDCWAAAPISDAGHTAAARKWLVYSGYDAHGPGPPGAVKRP